MAADFSNLLPWGAQRERPRISASLSTDSENVKPGVYVMRAIITEFTVIVEKNISSILAAGNDEKGSGKLLSKVLQRGEDSYFDQILSTLGALSENCLPSILKTLFSWYEKHGVEPIVSDDNAKGAKADSKGKYDLQHYRSDMAIAREKRDLAVDFVFCLVLIEVLKQFPFHPGHEDLVQHIEDLAFDHFRYRETSSLGPNAANIHIIADLYAEVLGVLAQSRFQSIKRKFFNRLRDLRAREPSTTTTQSIISLLMGMKFFRIKMVPFEDFELSFQFMQECATYFNNVKDKDIKHAIAGLFVEILVPVAAVVKNEVNVPCLKNFVDSLYSTTLDMCSRSKHRLAIFPLVTCLLCVSQKGFFLHNWHYFMAMCLQQLKSRDSKMSRVALESLYRLLWVYMIRIKCESNNVTNSRLQSIVNSLFPKGSKTIVPRDAPLNIFVKIIQFIAQEKLDFAMKEIVFDLLSVGRPIKVVNSPERMSIGLRAFLVVSDSLQQKEGDPPMPRTVAITPSGSTLRVKKKTFLNQLLTDETARSIGIASYYPYVRRIFNDILRALDSQLGKPFLMISSQVNSKEPDDFKPKLDLFRTVIAAIPRLIPDGMDHFELIELLSRLTVHSDEELSGLACQSLQNLTIHFTQWREDVLFGYMQFLVKEVTDQHPIFVDNCLRLVVQLFSVWSTSVSSSLVNTSSVQSKMHVGHRCTTSTPTIPSPHKKNDKSTHGPPSLDCTTVMSRLSSPPACDSSSFGGVGQIRHNVNVVSADNGVKSSRLDTVTTLHMAEGLSLVMLCHPRLSTRRLAFLLLKEAQKMFLSIDSEYTSVLKSLDNMSYSVLNECIETLPSTDRTVVVQCSQIIDFGWIVERNTSSWNTFNDDGTISQQSVKSSSEIPSQTQLTISDPWSICLISFLSPDRLPSTNSRSVYQAWPTVHTRSAQVFNLVDPSPIGDNRSSLLRPGTAPKRAPSEIDMYSLHLWKVYIIVGCRISPPSDMMPTAISGSNNVLRSVSPDINTSSSPESSSLEQHPMFLNNRTSYILDGSVKSSHASVLSPIVFYKLLLPLVRSENSEMRESVVCALGRISCSAIYELINELSMFMRESIDRKQENVRRRRRRDALRLHLIRIFVIVCKHGTLSASNSMDQGQSLPTSLIDYIDATRSVLDGLTNSSNTNVNEKDASNSVSVKELNTNYMKFVLNLIEGFQINKRVHLLKSDVRCDLFHYIKRFIGCLGKAFSSNSPCCNCAHHASNTEAWISNQNSRNFIHVNCPCLVMQCSDICSHFSSSMSGCQVTANIEGDSPGVHASVNNPTPLLLSQRQVMCLKDIDEFHYLSLKTLLSVLCCGPIFDEKNILDNGSLFHFLDIILMTKNEEIHNLASRSIFLLLEYNPNCGSILDWVVDRCFTGDVRVSDACFLALATIFASKEYPCDHYLAIINVTLLNTDCPRPRIKETALQLFHILERRFFVTHGEIGGPEYCSDNGVDAATHSCKTRSRLVLSHQLSQKHSQLTMPMFSEICQRLQNARPSVVRSLLLYLVPWLYNIELINSWNDDGSDGENEKLRNSFTSKFSNRPTILLRTKVDQQIGSKEATEMVLNNLFYITIKLSDEYNNEVEELWSALSSIRKSNLSIILDYMFIMCGLSQSHFISYAKRVAVYSARSQPSHTMNQLLIELQTVEVMNYSIERSEAPPFFRINLIRKGSNQTTDSSTVSSGGKMCNELKEFNSGIESGGSLFPSQRSCEQHVHRERSETSITGSIKTAGSMASSAMVAGIQRVGEKVRALSGTTNFHSRPGAVSRNSQVSNACSVTNKEMDPSIPENTVVEGNSDKTVCGNIPITDFRNSQSRGSSCEPCTDDNDLQNDNIVSNCRANPLPMPEFGGYFAPLNELMKCKDKFLVSAPLQRCNLAVILLSDCVSEGCFDGKLHSDLPQHASPSPLNIDWTSYVPIILHIALLGMDNNKPIVFSHCQTLVMNLLVLLCDWKELTSPISPFSYELSKTLMKHKVKMKQLEICSLINSQAGMSKEIPSVQGNDPSLFLTVVEILSSHSGKSLWKYEDITKNCWSIESGQSLANLTSNLLHLFEKTIDQSFLSLPGRPSSLASLWAHLSLKIALSCSSRHFAGRSLQICRAIGISPTPRMVSDILSRLIETISEPGEDIQGYVTELLLTLDSMVNRFDSVTLLIGNRLSDVISAAKVTVDAFHVDNESCESMSRTSVKDVSGEVSKITEKSNILMKSTPNLTVTKSVVTSETRENADDRVVERNRRSLESASSSSATNKRESKSSVKSSSANVSPSTGSSRSSQHQHLQKKTHSTALDVKRLNEFNFCRSKSAHTLLANERDMGGTNSSKTGSEVTLHNDETGNVERNIFDVAAADGQSSSTFRSSTGIMDGSDNIASEDSEERLNVLSQIFWIAVSLLESDFEHEFLLAIKLLDSVLQKIYSASSIHLNEVVHDKLQRVQNQLKWSSFPGVHSLVLKGCTSSATFDSTIQMLVRLTPLLDIAPPLFDCSGFSFPLNVISLLPYMLLHYQDTNDLCVLAAENIARMSTEKDKKLENLATVMTLYSRRTFNKESFQWTKCVVKYLFDMYSQHALGMMLLLVEMLDKGPLNVQQHILTILLCLLHYVDMNHSSNSLNTDVLRTITKFIETQHWKEALKVLKLTVTRSSSLIAPNSNSPSLTNYPPSALQSQISSESTSLMTSSLPPFTFSTASDCGSRCSSGFGTSSDQNSLIGDHLQYHNFGKKELPGRTMDFTFDLNSTPLVGRKLMGIQDRKSIDTAYTDDNSTQKQGSGSGGIMSPKRSNSTAFDVYSNSVNASVRGWKRPWLCQGFVREHLINLLNTCGQNIELPNSPSVIFSQTSELLERQSSMASSTEEVSTVNNDLSTDSKQHDTTDTEKRFGVYMREFDFLEYELESLEGESVDNFNWGVRRPHFSTSCSSSRTGDVISTKSASGSVINESRPVNEDKPCVVESVEYVEVNKNTDQDFCGNDPNATLKPSTASAYKKKNVNVGKRRRRKRTVAPPRRTLDLNVSSSSCCSRKSYSSSSDDNNDHSSRSVNSSDETWRPSSHTHIPAPTTFTQTPFKLSKRVIKTTVNEQAMEEEGSVPEYDEGEEEEDDVISSARSHDEGSLASSVSTTCSSYGGGRVSISRQHDTNPTYSSVADNINVVIATSNDPLSDEKAKGSSDCEDDDTTDAAPNTDDEIGVQHLYQNIPTNNDNIDQNHQHHSQSSDDTPDEISCSAPPHSSQLLNTSTATCVEEDEDEECDVRDSQCIDGDNGDDDTLLFSSGVVNDRERVWKELMISKSKDENIIPSSYSSSRSMVDGLYIFATLLDDARNCSISVCQQTSTLIVKEECSFGDDILTQQLNEKLLCAVKVIKETATPLILFARGNELPLCVDENPMLKFSVLELNQNYENFLEKKENAFASIDAVSMHEKLKTMGAHLEEFPNVENERLDLTKCVYKMLFQLFLLLESFTKAISYLSIDDNSSTSDVHFSMYKRLIQHLTEEFTERERLFDIFKHPDVLSVTQSSYQALFDQFLTDDDDHNMFSKFPHLMISFLMKSHVCEEDTSESVDELRKKIERFLPIKKSVYETCSEMMKIRMINSDLNEKITIIPFDYKLKTYPLMEFTIQLSKMVTLVQQKMSKT